MSASGLRRIRQDQHRSGQVRASDGFAPGVDVEAANSQLPFQVGRAYNWQTELCGFAVEGGAYMGDRLAGRQVIVTCAKDFMGPAICEVFREEGAVVIADTRDLRPVHAAAALIKEAGHVDVLIVNLIAPDPRIVLEQDTTEELWHVMFDSMVHPLYRLVHAVLPQMRERRAGKIVVMGSANALRGTNNRSAYSAARGAQVSYVRSVGLELAPFSAWLEG